MKRNETDDGKASVVDLANCWTCYLKQFLHVTVETDFVLSQTSAQWDRPIMPNTHCRRDETVLSRRRRRCEHNSHLAHDDCRRILLTVWKLVKETP